MRLGLSLFGTLSDGSLAEGWLVRTQEWLHESWPGTLISSGSGQSHDGQRFLRFQLHPAAQDVEIRVMGRHQISLSASTAGVGPGYHAHVCEVAHALEEELGVVWSEIPGEPPDPTAFFSTGNLPALEAAHLDWLRGEGRRLSALPNLEGTRLGLSGPHRFRIGDAVATPLGPRDRAWIKRIAEHPEQGKDVFSWWDLGVGPSFLLGRARVQMWLGIRWRKPVLDSEKAQIAEVLHLLHRAQEANPHLDYPWHEWAELCQLGSELGPLPGGDEAAWAGRAEAAAASGMPIGYRRSALLVELGEGWSIEIPGSFSEDWGGGASYTAWAEGKTVMVDLLSGRSSSPPSSRNSLLELPIESRRSVTIPDLPSNYEVVASFGEASTQGDRLGRLQALVRTGGSAASVVITVDTPTDEPWALRTLASLRCV